MPQNYCPALCGTKLAPHILYSRKSPPVFKKILFFFRSLNGWLLLVNE